MWRKGTDVEIGTFAILTNAPLGFLGEELIRDVSKEFFDECESVLFEFVDVPVGVVVLPTESLERFGRGGLAGFSDSRDWLTTSENVSHEAFDGEVGEGSPHGSEVASWLHGDFESVKEVLGDDRSGFVIDDIEVPVDFREHVDDAGPFDVDRDGILFMLTAKFLLCVIC